MGGSNSKFLQLYFYLREKYKSYISFKALHSELFAELSGRFSGRNEYFRISELRIVRHFFEVFGKFGISKLPKLPKFPNIRKNQFPKLPNFFRNYRTFFRTFYRTFSPKNRVFCPKTSNFSSFFRNFRNLRNFRIVFELFTEPKLPNFLPNFFRGNFRSSEIPVITEKFPYFSYRTFPKLAKTNSSEISV